MEELKSDKTTRILKLYTKLMNGYTINKIEEAQNSGVNERGGVWERGSKCGSEVRGRWFPCYKFNLKFLEVNYELL